MGCADPKRTNYSLGWTIIKSGIFNSLDGWCAQSINADRRIQRYFHLSLILAIKLTVVFGKE
jgi:hypothetical protein